MERPHLSLPYFVWICKDSISFFCELKHNQDSFGVSVPMKIVRLIEPTLVFYENAARDGRMSGQRSRCINADPINKQAPVVHDRITHHRCLLFFLLNRDRADLSMVLVDQRIKGLRCPQRPAA